MGRTIEEPIPLEESYRLLLRAAVAAAGTQDEVARLAGVNQGTISKTLSGSVRATYTTLIKLSRVLPGLPAPVVAVRDAEHERWCVIGAQLCAERPEDFRAILRTAEIAVSAGGGPTTEQVERLRMVIATPVPNAMTSKRKRRHV